MLFRIRGLWLLLVCICSLCGASLEGVRAAPPKASASTKAKVPTLLSYPKLQLMGTLPRGLFWRTWRRSDIEACAFLHSGARAAKRGWLRLQWLVKGQDGRVVKAKVLKASKASWKGKACFLKRLKQLVFPYPKSRNGITIVRVKVSWRRAWGGAHLRYCQQVRAKIRVALGRARSCRRHSDCRPVWIRCALASLHTRSKPYRLFQRLQHTLQRLRCLRQPPCMPMRPCGPGQPRMICRKRRCAWTCAPIQPQPRRP